MNYIKTPSKTLFSDIVKNRYSLSASQYRKFEIKNKNTLKVSDFLERPLNNCDLGYEVGSDSYCDSGTKKFIKTKALQEESFLLQENSESIETVVPQVFVQKDLKCGDIIISKDSNVGEVIILEKDYPDYMMSGALYRLPNPNYKYYLLAMLKNQLVREQINFMVPRGSTIRHGKTIFLNCKIPIPNNNMKIVMEYVETLTKAIINKEILIKSLYEKAIDLIRNQILNNQNHENEYSYTYPSIKEIKSLSRLDSALYSDDYKKKTYMINNCAFKPQKICSLVGTPYRGQNLQVSNIGESIYSDVCNPKFYTLIKPTNILETGIPKKVEYIGNVNKLSCLHAGDVVFGAEGTFRSFVVIEESERIITNIHGIVFPQKKHDYKKGIVLKFMLDYYREQGILQACAVGGNGGSLAIQYLELLNFPSFSENIENKLSNCYYSGCKDYNDNWKSIKEFLEYDSLYNSKAGIYELNKSKNILQNKLNEVIEKIANDEPIAINN